jgi:hypothetical protein
MLNKLWLHEEFMLKRLPIKLCIMMSVALLVGCSSIGITDLFFGYSQQMKQSRAAQLRGDFVRAETSIITVNSRHNNYALSQLEKARLQFLAGNWSASQKSFEKAYEQVSAQEQAAKVQISRGLKKASSAVSNDNVIAYEIPSYEQGMLHSYQALNYLYQGSLEGALVEIRRANIVQERALETNKTELLEAQKIMVDKGINSNSLQKNYPSMDNLIGEVKNSYQNAYTFYLSGLLYEAGKQPNDAYIDYKRAIEIYPDNTYLQQDVLRLAKQLGMFEDYEFFKQKFGSYNANDKKISNQVVVIFEQGIVNAREEARLNLPFFDNNDDYKFFTFSLPIYRGNLSSEMPLNISINEKSYASQEIVRLQSLATKNLKDQLPGLVTRQALRIVAKEKLRRNLKKSGGDVGNILASLYNVASERADTRSWSSLPENVQIVRIEHLSAGHQELLVSYAGKREIIEIDVAENSTTIINFTAIGEHTSYKTISL